ncbi:MAG: 2-C-methyl-D-erythritol 2,4-cyclodiphosphate synthase [Nitrospirae bacterium]|nr:2-C-methyl-D-erythritol 2,4-cyclodiphosphate synthase [Nitrospirota bacterium]
MRVGIGVDIHPFREGRPLVLGGVRIPHDRGLDGHSDADVLLHAICDALLGAAGKGDIGIHFPNTDPRYKGIDSRELLARCRALLEGEGFRIVNIDGVVVAERPKILPYVSMMIKNISDILAVDPGRINLKATTCEGLGFVGRQEGIAAQAVCLLKKDV